MLISIGQLLAYTLIQTFGVSIFTLSLYRLQKIPSVYRWRSFFYLLLVNAAGTMTFGLAPWLQTSQPVAAGLFILGIPFMLLSHLWLLRKRR